MLSNLQKIIRKNVVNIPGWRTDRKILVIESDDWGSVRMPSREIYDLLLSKGVAVDQDRYLKYDCLESETDLEALFEVLFSFKDYKGNHPVITANAIVANPDFEKIKANGFEHYHYQVFTDTYKQYPNHDKCLDLWLESGMKGGVFWPQYHGREHYNAKRWLRVLRLDRPFERLAFNNGLVLGVNMGDSPANRTYQYMAAFEYEQEEDKPFVEEMTVDGLKIFEDIFGIPSLSFVASQGIRGEHIDPFLLKMGVKCHQGGQFYEPDKKGGLKTVNHFWGAKNQEGQLFWRRNATFEPSKDRTKDWVDSCMQEINIAFRWKKPAVINSHRVNYIGTIHEHNRRDSLKELKRLLQQVLKKWPDVEFMSSEALGLTMLGKSRKS